MKESGIPGFNTGEKTTADHPFGLFNIELTNCCPMKCIMCPRTNHMTRDQGFMETGLFKKIITELAEANRAFHHDKVVWLHHFGESLLHPQFEECISYASEKGVRTGLSVNPMMLNKNTSKKLLSSGLHILYLSMDGHDNESFFRIRGVKDMYEASRSRTMDFLKMKKDNMCNMIVTLSMIDFSLNDESVAAVKKEWESHEGVDEFLLKNYITWDGAIPEIKDLAPDCIKKKNSFSRKVTCSFPWTNLTVTWDGDVVPCCFDYNKKLVLGNAATHSLNHIWNDKPMQNLRKEFINNRVENPLCRNCDNLYN